MAMSSLKGAPIPGQRAGGSTLTSLPGGEALGRQSGGMLRIEDDDMLGELDLLKEEEEEGRRRKKEKKTKKEKKAKKVKKEKKAEKKEGGHTTTTTTTTTSAKDTPPAEDSYDEYDDYQDDFVTDKNDRSESYSDNFEAEKSDDHAAHAAPTPTSTADKIREAEEQALLEKKRREWEAKYRNPPPEPAAHGRPPVSPRYSKGSIAEPAEQTPQPSSIQGFVPSPQTTPLRDAARVEHHQPQQLTPQPQEPVREVAVVQQPGPVTLPEYREDRTDDRWAKEHARRQRRALERRKQQMLAEEEVAASAVMKRLANDVKSIFQELNMSIVAAERDRHQKEERYRKEREARDRAYEEERAMRDERDRRERELREEKFWESLREQEKNRAAEEQERRHRERVEHEERLREEQEERQRRLDRELTHTDKMDSLERERRSREDEAFREREQAAYKAQLESYQRASKQQTEELQLRMQSELDHLKEMRRIEIANMEKRHQDALVAQRQQYEHSVQVFDKHRLNAEKLEALVSEVKDSIRAVSDLNERANDHHAEMLKEREGHLAKQEKAQEDLLEQINQQKEGMEKERQRLASLYGKFESSITSYAERHAEEIKNLQAAQARANNMRDIVEEQRMRTVKEVHNEMVALEQRRSELDEERFAWLKEAQEQRLETAKERSELAKMLERVRKEEVAANTSMQEAQQKLSIATLTHGEAADKQRFIESEYRRLEHFKEETLRKLEEEQRSIESEKSRVEALMVKVNEDSERALQLRKAAAEDKQWAVQAKNECVALKHAAEDERKNLDLIRRKAAFEKQQLQDLKTIRGKSPPEQEKEKENRTPKRTVAKHSSVTRHADPGALVHAQNAQIAAQQQSFLRSIQVENA